jgi:membrane protein YqaA with SNARE-associated domain
MSIFNKLLTWTQDTFAPLGAWGLFLLAFIESSFFPIPPDILLIALSLAAPEQAFFLAFICTLGSALGGMLGYGIGYIGQHAVLEKFVSHRKIAKVHRLFNKYEAWAIGIAGFTPIPYKVFTIAAGVFYIDFKKFVLISFLSRGARFFLVASLIFYFGQPISDFLNSYFDIISLVAVALLIPIYLIYKRIKNKKIY